MRIHSFILSIFILMLSISTTNAEELYAFLSLTDTNGVKQQQTYHIKNDEFKPLGAKADCKSFKFYSPSGNAQGIFYCNNKNEAWLRGAKITKETGLSWIGNKVMIPMKNYKANIGGRSGFKLPAVFANIGNINYSIGLPILNDDGSVESIVYSPLGTKWVDESLFFIEERNLVLREGVYSHKTLHSKRKYELFQLLLDSTLHKLASYNDPKQYQGLSKDSGQAPSIKETKIDWLNNVNKTTVSRAHKRWIKASPSYYQHFKVSFTSNRGEWEATSRAISESEYQAAQPQKKGPLQALANQWIDDNDIKYYALSNKNEKTLTLRKGNDAVKVWNYFPEWETVDNMKPIQTFNQIHLENE